MKKIFYYLLDFFKEHGSISLLLGFSIFLGLSFYVNYHIRPTSLSFQDWRSWPMLYGFYVLPYFVGVLGYALAFQKHDFWQKPEFWVLSAAILLVPTLNGNCSYYRDWGVFEINYFIRKVSFNLHSSVVYAGIPLAILLLYNHQPYSKTFFGCTAQNFDWLTYTLMMLIMLPLLWWASYRPDFLETYPRYLPSHAEPYWGVPAWLTVGAYELSYAIQFVALEIFFRGFIVFALSKFLGGGAIYPMVLVYAYIHFGKPMPEALGSIFGGLILGVVALRTGSVFGGMFIHIGVALGMEIFAFRQMPNSLF
ncbi:MAG: CPBP family intramembrane metalloprotease [Cytophagales bacterium]|nr:MAG: CPBP family intramembrane metalloprotease [Cytophagales bacterium]TAF60153.1 MAG: CPBP family intramembrane metalloprotease [Cytophagales bacterium]